MAKTIVLGGCGAVGRIAVKTLANTDSFSEITIGDINITEAEALCRELRGNRVSAVQVDALDKAGIKDAISGYDLVVNCVGPFYKTVMNIAQATIEAGIDYVDVCDDVDVTINLLEMSQKAQQAGITMVIGMGNSPGATNLLAKFASDNLLDETESIDIFHAHGGEPFEGKGVIGHRFHCMSIDIPMYMNGVLTYVKFFEKEGVALRQPFDFPILGDNIMVYPYPHPEQVTLPKYLNVNRVTNRGTILPAAYYELTKELCRLGLTDKEPVDIDGQKIAPYDFATAYLIRERERILKETDFGSQRGCTSTIVKGKKDGKTLEVRFHMASESQALGEGTGIPVAIAAILMQQGKITTKGVYPPEGCMKPVDFIELVPVVLEKTRDKDSTHSEELIVEIIDENGKKTTMDMLSAASMVTS
jgi:saccharopine dehydrogenase (NAD+, L-lysine-forming)